MLFVLGLVVGCVGTLIGAGGGFILMPVLILLYPADDPALLASISLAVVCANAASGSIGYAFQKRIDYRAGLIFSAAAMPGAILGALTTGLLPRRAFDIMLGVCLTATSVFLAFSGASRAARNGNRTAEKGPEAGAVNPLDSPCATAQPAETRASAQDGPNINTSLAQADNPVEHRPPRITYAAERGAAISFAVGFVSSLLGIGGGIIHVPALVLLLGFPVHVATATSHFVLALTALAGTGVHVATGTLHRGGRRTAALGLGVVLGAQIGARLARHAPPTLILRGLAAALALVGIRIMYTALHISGPAMP